MGIKVESKDERIARACTEIYEAIDQYTYRPIMHLSRLEEDLGLDSLNFVELALDIEHEFGIDVPDAVIGGWHTVDDVINSVAELIRAE